MQQTRKKLSMCRQKLVLLTLCLVYRMDRIMLKPTISYDKQHVNFMVVE